jgi:NAD(P)-dependent dehydrogenase (short-subunit alcohol dehydrogenase family)
MQLPDGSNKNILELFKLDGRKALITGGAKGLGRVMAQAFSEAGAEVAIASRTLADCEKAAAEISASTGNKVFAAALDATSEDDVNKLKANLDANFGAIDILINNAGINIRGNIQDLSKEDFESVMATNVTGPFLVSRAFGPAMCERGWGRVINLGSIMSVISMAGRTPYASSKAAVLGFTRTLALEWAANGVTVNAICPGPFATEMNLPLLNDPEKYQAFLKNIPVGRWGHLHEIAGPALFLASEAAGFVTGSSLLVDGGWTAW